MSDDLVDRMRRACTLGAAIKLLDEAANEIERLRVDLRDTEAMVAYWRDEYDVAQAALRELRDDWRAALRGEE